MLHTPPGLLYPDGVENYTEHSPSQDNAPVYNIKAVARMLGLLPVTLRAWERRYGLPSPQRGDQGYRLYSEYDLRTLRWLKNQVDSGLSIGRAAELLQDMRLQNNDPASLRVAPQLDQPISPLALQHGLYQALLRFDENLASQTLRQAFGLYPLDTVLMDIVRPTLVELGEAWHRGELSIAVEHFATQYCLQQLMSMLASSAPPTQPGVIVAACGPGEQHEIGLLMLVVMLRWRGRDVRYLGPNMPLDDLAETVGPLQPVLLLLSATRVETLPAIQRLPEILKRFPQPAPRVVVGGQAFLTAQLPPALIHLSGSPTEVISQIEVLLRSPGQPLPGPKVSTGEVVEPI